MAMELIVARHELLKKNADALGIEMVDVTAPDPTAEAGLSASQQFILEDVPQQLKKYEGKKLLSSQQTVVCSLLYRPLA